MPTNTTLKGPRGALLHLDSSRIIPDDPGADTPALVEYRGNWGTYWCASETGECDGFDLPDSVLAWLNSDEVANAVEAMFEGVK